MTEKEMKNLEKLIKMTKDTLKQATEASSGIIPDEAFSNMSKDEKMLISQTSNILDANGNVIHEKIEAIQKIAKRVEQNL